MRCAIALAVLLTLFSSIWVADAHAQQTDVIRGRITRADSTPIEGAGVKATSYQGTVEKTTTTDKSGRFTLIFINGEGDYWIELTKIGYTQKRFEIRRVGDEEVLIADARMSEAAAKLDKVAVTAQRTRATPNRNATSPDVSGGDKPLNPNGVPADQSGNLAAMAASVAGIQLIPGLDGATDMFSMLGLSGDQNNTTFDGLGSGVTALPPDILATTSIRPYPFDVSIGGFSGAQVSIQTIPGSNFSRRMMANVDITPPLEWANDIAVAQGQKFTNARLGGNAAGPLALNKAFYNTAYNVGRQFSDLRTLLNTNRLGLTAAGVAPDSAARFLHILGNQGIPIAQSGLPTVEARDVAQAVANLDLVPSASGTGSSFTFGGAASYQRTTPVSRGGLLLTTPAHSGEVSVWGANGVVAHTNYLWSTVLSRTTLGLAASGNTQSPFESIPEGSVRVASLFPDGTSSVKALSFGGSPIQSALSTHALQLNNQLSWYSLDNKHTIKLTSGVIEDEFRTSASQSPLGTYTYTSLADLAAERPASFTRTFGVTTQSSRQFTAAASLGDYWRPSQNLQVQYGLRADANRFLDAPATNESLLNALGVHNATVPNHVYLSPRVGLQWYYGNSPQVAYAPGAARPPRAVIHAGAGLFQNVAPAQLIGGAIAQTGLSGSAQSVTCVGPATPLPDWNAFATSSATIPTRCAGGSTGSLLATGAPNVTLFDPAFRQAASLRAAADWSGPILDNRFVLGVQAIASSGMHQQGMVDINLVRTAQFTLANEKDRPVFVDASTIVPTTGAMSIVSSRLSRNFQHVWEEQSGLRVSSRQVSVNLKPVTANPMLRWDATYTLLDAHESFNGFSSTAGNPFDVQSGRSLQQGRHTITLQWNDFPFFDVVYVSAVLRVMSGQRFTPLVAGDVNGDGALNDRAFIANPAAAADSALASGMRALLTSATPSVRDCLTRQLNRVADRGSCQAPWTALAGLQVKFNPQKIGLPKRATVMLQIQNPLAIADLALHGDNGLRGWGQTIAPDQNLLFVRGFDPAKRAFSYQVNERFGSTRPQQSATYALPYVSLGINFDIGLPRERQLLTQRLDMGRGQAGSKATSDAMTIFGMSSIPNPMLLILQQSDSLGLTRTQADSLAMLSRAYAQFADSVWTPIGRYLAALPATYSTRAAYDRYVSARERTVDFLLTLVPAAKGVLTPRQRRELPMQVANFLDERVLKFLRSSSAGDASSIVIR